MGVRFLKIFNYQSRAHQTSKHPGSKNPDSDAAGLA